MNAEGAPPAERPLKLAVLSESPADEFALQTVIPGIVRRAVRFEPLVLRARGWPSVLQVLPAVARHLHFTTDVDALVVGVDSDDSPVHDETHERKDYFHPQCRLCQLRATFRQATKRLPPAHGRERLLRGIGVAVPAIEAWYLCGEDQGVTEAAWREGRESGRLPYTRKDLKWRAYGTDRPSLEMEITKARQAMGRHYRDSRRLENDFLGFRLLADDLRVIATLLANHTR
ncbi:hypothetical protein [Nibricoccus sp. IMCC34717]|uniref:hypothetical protein n=1 Tax=Nibricoccus sp. IMCC34717 TaxID=3034021 RepID=UPI00384F57A9